MRDMFTRFKSRALGLYCVCRFFAFHHNNLNRLSFSWFDCCFAFLSLHPGIFPSSLVQVFSVSAFLPLILLRNHLSYIIILFFVSLVELKRRLFCISALESILWFPPIITFSFSLHVSLDWLALSLSFTTGFGSKIKPSWICDAFSLIWMKDIGFNIPDKFIIGYNLDYNDYFRELNVSVSFFLSFCYLFMTRTLSRDALTSHSFWSFQQHLLFFIPLIWYTLSFESEKAMKMYGKCVVREFLVLSCHKEV